MFTLSLQDANRNMLHVLYYCSERCLRSALRRADANPFRDLLDSGTLNAQQLSLFDDDGSDDIGICRYLVDSGIELVDAVCAECGARLSADEATAASDAPADHLAAGVVLPSPRALRRVPGQYRRFDLSGLCESPPAELPTATSPAELQASLQFTLQELRVLQRLIENLFGGPIAQAKLVPDGLISRILQAIASLERSTHE